MSQPWRALRLEVMLRTLTGCRGCGLRTTFCHDLVCCVVGFTVAAATAPVWQNVFAQPRLHPIGRRKVPVSTWNVPGTHLIYPHTLVPSTHSLVLRLSCSAHVLSGTITQLARQLWQGFAFRFERALRACAHNLDPLRSLCAMDRCLRDDCLRDRARCGRTILAGIDAAMRDLAVADCARCQLHPKSKICIQMYQPRPARTPHSLNSPAHTRMFWWPGDLVEKPP